MIEEAHNAAKSQLNDDPSERRGNSAQVITNSLLQHVPSIVETCGAAALFIYVDAMDEGLSSVDLPVEVDIFCVTKAPAADTEARFGGMRCLRVPNVPLTRIGQVKIAIFLALAKGLIKHGDRIVFLSGPPAGQTLDTIIVTEVGDEYEIFASDAELTAGPRRILPEVIERVVDIASELGSEGREGRALGAMFVIGDTDRVLPLTRQLVLNPFKGYPPNERNILDYSLEETVKELATLDGAFIIQSDGVMETCGAYIHSVNQKDLELPRGLGARHHAAAGITMATDSVAVTVSESTGSITIFSRGRIITEIQKPRSAGEKRRFRSQPRRRGHHEL